MQKGFFYQYYKTERVQFIINLFARVHVSQLKCKVIKWGEIARLKAPPCPSPILHAIQHAVKRGNT